QQLQPLLLSAAVFTLGDVSRKTIFVSQVKSQGQFSTTAIQDMTIPSASAEANWISSLAS
ncbi:hypothetical protein ATANTOWER_017069, partial [Ataeniobius toweri]|nr:hypothetical protein [Ataeniobius toweri]